MLVGIDDTMKEALAGLYGECKQILYIAPDEDECSDDENEVYADFENITESIKYAGDIVSEESPEKKPVKDVPSELKNIHKKLKQILNEAPDEDICTNEENEIFANIANLINSLKNSNLMK